MTPLCRALLGATLLSLVCWLPLVGQSFTATLSGIITDPSGGVIPGAQLTVTNVETNVAFFTRTDLQGRYVVPSLPPGFYSLSVQANGFRQLVRGGVQLQVDQRLRLDLSLELGPTTEVVSVSAEAPLVERERSSLGAVVGNRQLTNVPLNDRSVIQLVGLVPGVILGRSFSGESFNGAANFMINGGRGNTSDILADGISSVTGAANPINILPVSPPVEAVQEFRVQTNNLSAEFGRTGGGVINFIYKSGTNEIHGSAFEFLRNSALDANNFFSNRQGIPLASFQRHQFGATVGGPVVIPGLVNGRDKLFFFISYEGLRQSAQSTQTFTFPTARERAGDFSQTFRLSAGRCDPVSIYDPFSTRRLEGGGFVRTQFPNNIIPHSAFDPVAQRAVSFYPEPNNPGNPCTGTNNFTASNPNRRTVNQLDTRVDVNPTSSDKIFLRLSARRSRSTGADSYANVASPVGNRIGQLTPGQNVAFSYTRIVSPSLLADVRFGLARFREFQFPASGEGFDVQSTLGLTGTFVDQMAWTPTFPRFNVSGFGSLGTSGSTDQHTTSYQWASSVTKIKDAHTLKTGVDFRVMQSAGPNGLNNHGTYTFASNFTQGPNPTRSGPAVGNSMASLLLGMGTGSILIPTRVYTSSNYLAVYLQDEYRVTRRLILNLGLRYDLETGRKDRYDHLSWFDFTAPSPLALLVPELPHLRGGLRFVNVDGNSKRQYLLDKNNLGPRFGFAYSLNPETVVRGGYGIFYEPYSGRASSSGAGYVGFSALTTWISSLDGITPLNPLRNPYPDGLNIPAGSAPGMLAAIGEDLSAGSTSAAYDRTARVGYVQQWNFTLQRGLPGNLAVELAYAGNKGTKLTNGGGFEENQLPPEFMSLGNSLLQSVPNPFFGIIESGPLAAPTATRGQLLRPYPHFLGVQNFRPNAASSSYHAFQARFEKRFSRGVQFSVAYTAGKVIDDSSNLVTILGGAGAHQDYYNRRADRSVSLHDISQRLAVGYVIDLPFGQGKPFGSKWGRLPDFFLGGWQLNGISTFQTGLPFLITNSSNNSGAFSATQRPNISGNPQLPDDRPKQDKLARWFDTSQFSQPAPFTFGNAPRVLNNVRSDGISEFDVSVFKNFTLSNDGIAKIQFRAEAFNLFNAPVFGPPGGSFGAGSFGVVSSQQNTPRQIQFGLKIVF